LQDAIPGRQTPRTRVRNLAAPLRYEDENTPISDAFTRQVRQALDNLRDKRGVTVPIIGYTDDAPLTGLDESTYGNHLSLSKGRAPPRRIGNARKSWDCPQSAIEATAAGIPPACVNDE